MILQKLIEHSKTLDLPTSFYSPTEVKYVFDINVDDVQNIKTEILDGGRGNKDRGKVFNLPTQSNQKAAKLLFGNAEFVCGIPKDDNSTELQVGTRHTEFLKLLEECEEVTKNNSLSVIREFYKTSNYKEYFLNIGFNPAMNISFKVNGEYPFEQVEIQQFWAKRNSEKDGISNVECHLCGVNPAVVSMANKIKGGRIPGGQTSGMPVISINKKSFESFGLPRSKTSPTCSGCSEKFTFTLNHLLADEDSHLTVGKQVYVFWSKGEAFSPAKVLQKPDDFFGDLTFEDHIDPEEVKLMFKSAFSGRASAIENHDDKFYAAAFSAAGARVVLRDWIETTIPETKEKLAQFFADCFIKYQDHPNGVFSLASSTVFDARKDLPPNTFTKLLNTALKGARLPEDLLYRAINRAKAEKTPITHPRASIIKLYYLTNNKHKEIDMVQLDKMTKKPAYLCGRLMSVLEEIQSSALGTTNATIVDRYYGTASTAPATVFSTLLSGTRHHLGKLRKQKPGFYINLEKKLQEVVSELPEFPKVLSLEEQGLFALGYYHQKQERFQKTKKEEIE